MTQQTGGSASEDEQSDGLRTRFDNLGNAQLLASCGVVLAGIGSLLPWFSVDGGVVLGIESVGVITLPIAVLVVTVLAFYGFSRNIGLLCAAGGLLVASLSFFTMTGSSLFGTYATFLGGIAMVFGGLLLPG